MGTQLSKYREKKIFSYYNNNVFRCMFLKKKRHYLEKHIPYVNTLDIPVKKRSL